MPRRALAPAVAGFLSFVLASAAAAQETVRLREVFPVGYQYRVKARVDLEGTLNLPATKEKPAPAAVSLRGDSALEYDERVLAASPDGRVSRTLRVCRRMVFRRVVAEQLQETSLRPGVRRLVLLRQGHKEVPFSPDGPLTWGEIDQVRTDVFPAALGGLLPARDVAVGDRWSASPEAVLELTDFEKVEEGGLDCRLERLEGVGSARVARVSFSGTVRGPGEDGPGRQKLTGYLRFDLATNALFYLQLQGSHVLLGADGKEVGRIEGRFVLQREVNVAPPELSDAALKGLLTEPNGENTQLLYDNPELGLRFLYSRRWRVGLVRGSQVALDGADGSGLLLTLDPAAQVPSAAEFLAESRSWLEKQKGKVLRVVPPQGVRAAPPLDRFAIEAELAGQRFWMDYFVTRQAGGGVSLAARLPPRDLEAVRAEVERLARSLVVTRALAPRP